MSAHNLHDERRRNNAHRILDIAAAATLTIGQCRDNAIVKINTTAGAVPVTLPAPCDALKGVDLTVLNYGEDDTNDATVVNTGGFGGGAGDGSDTVTLASGDMAKILCDGAAWYALSHTTPA